MRPNCRTEPTSRVWTACRYILVVDLYLEREWAGLREKYFKESKGREREREWAGVREILREVREEREVQRVVRSRCGVCV